MFQVLYIDDEPQNLVSFKATFRHFYTIHTALSAAAGMVIMRQNSIDLVITDQRMPETTGVEFLEQIVPEYPECIRMILTGFSDIQDIIAAINSGNVFRYITKPWDFNELKMTLDQALAYYLLQRTNKHLLLDLHKKVGEQERMLSVFQKYVPPVIVQEMLDEHPASALRLMEGEEREVSVLFCDIRRFTEISGTLPANVVVQLLNQFYALVSRSVKKHNGFVNKFIGDEVLAVFGAPIARENNPLDAVRCAQEIAEGMAAFNQSIQHLTTQPLRVGIGINTGKVISGNLGSEEKLEYSITGDTVNVAKRVEQLTQNLPNGILLHANTWNRVQHQVRVKPWEPVAVKGKAELIQVYEVL